MALLRGVLVVDEDEHLRWLLETALKRSGYTVDQSRDGKEDFWLTSSNDRDVTILDIAEWALDKGSVLL